MRILILTHNFPPVEGGISAHCYEMARHWLAVHEAFPLVGAAGVEVFAQRSCSPQRHDWLLAVENLGAAQGSVFERRMA